MAMTEEDICFNRRVVIDFLTLERTSVLHVVDRDALFRAATFLPNNVFLKYPSNCTRTRGRTFSRRSRSR